MNYDEAIRGIIEYCHEQIDDFKERADLAVSKSWRERCPIECADYSLASSVVDCISVFLQGQRLQFALRQHHRGGHNLEHVAFPLRI